jgi:hypothetical protein
MTKHKNEVTSNGTMVILSFLKIRQTIKQLLVSVEMDMMTKDQEMQDKMPTNI